MDPYSTKPTPPADFTVHNEGPTWPGTAGQRRASDGALRLTSFWCLGFRVQVRSHLLGFAVPPF